MKFDLCVFDENEYFQRWMNQDYWRKQYIEFMTQNKKIKKANSLWTFDIFHIPYDKSKKNLTKACGLPDKVHKIIKISNLEIFIMYRRFLI